MCTESLTPVILARMFVVKSIVCILVLLVNVIMQLLHLQSQFLNLCVR